MRKDSLLAFQNRSLATEMELFGQPATLAGSQVTMLVRDVDALTAAAGGFNDALGERIAHVHQDIPPVVHSLVVLDGKPYRVTSVRTVGIRHSLTIRPTNSSK